MRSRNVKPGFFKNEDLSEIDPLGRLLFVGLWCLADRDGRLEDRPKRIKIEILPYDSCNVDKLLNALYEKNFILRYSINSKKFIQIVNFAKHQNPHMKEAESTIPAPDLSGANPVQEPDKHPDSPADSLNLIPDSLNLIPREKILSPGGSPPSLKKSAKKILTTIPDDFAVSAQVRAWAKEKGFDHLEDHLEVFKDLARSNGYEKADWDSTFKRAIREDWGKVRQNGGNGNGMDEMDRIMERAEAGLRCSDSTCSRCHGTGRYKTTMPDGTEGFADCDGPPGIMVFDPDCPICHGDPFKTMGQCKCGRTREEIADAKRREKAAAAAN